jgi:hypothetical protein
MNIYLICPVRNGTPGDVFEYVRLREDTGDVVHYPPRDVNQDDPTGARICTEHRAAMDWCDECHVFWDSTSSGSHFDLGMAYALRKPIKLVRAYQEDGAGKSYQKAVMSS